MSALLGVPSGLHEPLYVLSPVIDDEHNPLPYPAESEVEILEGAEPSSPVSALSVDNESDFPSSPVVLPSSEHDSDSETPPAARPFVIARKPVPKLHNEAVSEQVDSSAAIAPLSWRPSYLRRRVIFAFLALWIALIASLEVLYQISQQQRGLAASIQSRHYLWTYGPTAVLTIIAAFWARAEYQAKQVAPWARMATEGASASRTVLLDYVTPVAPMCIFRAIRNRDYLVGTSAFCSLLLKLMIVFSTGLLSLIPAEVRSTEVPLTLLNAFSDSNTSLLMGDTMPYFVTRGRIQNQLPYPEGTSPRFAFQTFDTSRVPRNSVIETTVDGFSAALECKPAELVVNKWQMLYPHNTPSSVPGQLSQNLTLKSPGCTISNASIIVATESLDNAFWANFVEGRCDNVAGIDGSRIIISAGEAIQHEEEGYDPSSREMQTGTANVTIVRSTQLICKPTYTISRIAVLMNNTGLISNKQFEIVLASPPLNRTLSTVHPWYIAQAQFDAYLSGAAFNSDYITAYSDYNITVNKQIEIGLIDTATDTGTMPTITELFQPEILTAVADRYYQSFSSQIARRSLMTGDQSVTVGSSVFIEDRLLVGQLSARVMEGIMLLMVLLTFWMIMLLPKGVLPREPSTIIGLAVVLANSQRQTFLEILRGGGAGKTCMLRERFAGCRFRSGNSARTAVFSIDVNGREWSGDEQVSRHSTNTPLTNAKWWEPFPVKPATRISISVLVLALTAALEAVLSISNKYNGLGDVPQDGYLHYTWAYVPAVTMVAIGLAFASLDFATKCLAPFSELETGTSFQKSLDLNFLDMMTPHAIVGSIKTRHWAVLLTTIAMVLSSFLTIVASGVFGAVTVPQLQEIQLRKRSWFTSDEEQVTAQEQQSGIFGAENSVVVAGLIINSNLSYPAWTYDELAFPSLSIETYDDEVLNTVNNNSAFVVSIIPAIRSKLECVMYRDDQLDVNLTWGVASEDYDLVNFLSVVTWAESCGRSYASSLDRVTPFYLNEMKRDGYFAMSSSASLSTTGCSQLRYMWGRIVDGNVTNVVGMGCNETAEEVDVKTTFWVSNMEIDPDRPPIPDEESRRPSSAFIPEYDDQYLPNVTTANNLDTFFWSLVYGKEGIPISSFGRTEDDDKVAKSIQHLVKIIRAQQFSNHMRIIANESTIAQTGPRLPATLTNTDCLRVVQDPISTRILEGLLVGMLVCATAAAFLMGTRRVVPKNPCTIAGLASMLADSNMLDGQFIPKGVWMNGWGDEQQDLISGSKYRMGWLNSSGEVSEKGESRFAIHISR